MYAFCGRTALIDRPPDQRLAVRTEKSAPLVGHYQRKGLLLTVREGDSRAAAEQILGAVAAQKRVLVQ